MSNDTSQRHGLSFYRSVLLTVIPLLLALVVPTLLLLGVLYWGGYVGGLSWLGVSSGGAVPQAVSMTTLETESLHGIAERPVDIGVRGEHAGDTALIRADEDAPPFIDLEGKSIPTGPFLEILGGDHPVSGYATHQDLLLSVSCSPQLQSCLLHSVGQELVRRLSAAAGSESVLLTSGERRVIASTWVDSEGRILFPAGSALEPDTEFGTIELDRPYAGYQGGNGEGSTYRFDIGKKTMSAFAASHTLPVLAGHEAVEAVILVPSSVMLYFNNLAIAMFLSLTLVIIVVSVVSLRRLSRETLRPMGDIARQIDALRARFVDFDRAGSTQDFPSKASANEIVLLGESLAQLEKQLVDYRALQSSMERTRRMEALGRLAGGIAHDFNNLLSVIQANSEILDDELEGEQVKEPLLDIRSATRDASELARKLMDFGRGPGSSSEEKTDLTAAVRATLPMLRRTLGPEMRIDQDVPDDVWVAIDPSSFQQILTNLVINAYDSLGGDNGHIAVSVVRGEGEEAGLWCLEVSDDGCGMAPEELDVVFEPFYTTKPQGERSGLGLAVVHGIVSAAGGRIRVESTPGQGSKFCVLLPTATKTESAEPQPRNSRLEGCRLLLVDDEPMVARALSRMLSQAGCHVDTFTSSRAALTMLQSSTQDDTPDVLITDVRMPELDGFELGRSVRQVHPELPILFISGFHKPSLTRQLPSRSIVLGKPVPRHSLLQTLRNLTGAI